MPVRSHSGPSGPRSGSEQSVGGLGTARKPETATTLSAGVVTRAACASVTVQTARSPATAGTAASSAGAGATTSGGVLEPGSGLDSALATAVLGPGEGGSCDCPRTPPPTTATSSAMGVAMPRRRAARPRRVVGFVGVGWVIIACS